MNSITDTIQEQRDHLNSVEAFFLTYPDLKRDEQAWFGTTKSLYFHDAALVGDALGKTGWTKEEEKYSHPRTINWIKNVDGFKVKICGCETLSDIDNAPVDPKSFPLQLTEASDIS